MYVRYFAVDGTDFATEKECRAYEHRLNALHTDVIAFDDNYSAMTLKESGDADRVYFVIFITNDGAEAFHNFLYDNGYRCKGLEKIKLHKLYGLNCDCCFVEYRMDEWILMDEILDVKRNELESLEAATKGMIAKLNKKEN